MISCTLGQQNPHWQRPIPALHLLLIPSIEVGTIGLCNASTISPSVTVSQRQMILPYNGFSLINAARSSWLICLNLFTFLVSTTFSFSTNSNQDSPSIFTRSTAIAGADVNPGEAIPEILKKPFCSLSSKMKKSCTAVLARTPAKLRIDSL